MFPGERVHHETTSHYYHSKAGQKYRDALSPRQAHYSGESKYYSNDPFVFFGDFGRQYTKESPLFLQG